MLRREFDAPKPIRRATVYATGLGFFDLYLNGARVGDHIMDPALTEYSKLILYVTFDVTRQLRLGKNALGVVLGNGRFFAPRAGDKTPAPFRTYGYPRLLLQLEIEYADGTTAARGERRRLEGHGRRPHAHEQRIRWRGIRRPQGNAGVGYGPL